MVNSVDALKLFMDEQVSQLKRSAVLEEEGLTPEAKALNDEWCGSALDAVYLSVDSFVKM